MKCENEETAIIYQQNYSWDPQIEYLPEKTIYSFFKTISYSLIFF